MIGTHTGEVWMKWIKKTLSTSQHYSAETTTKSESEMQKASFESINMCVPCTNQTCRHTVWSLIIGGFFTWVSVYGINQTQVQRYLTVKKRSQAVRWETFMCVSIAAFDLPSSPHCLQGNLVQCSGNRKPVTALWLRRHGKASICSFCSWWLNVATLQNASCSYSFL